MFVWVSRFEYKILKEQYNIPTYLLVNIAIRNALINEGMINESVEN